MARRRQRPLPPREKRLGPGLVLSRHVNQQTMIDLPHGEQIIITVTDIRHGRVRFHVQAPRQLAIRREEIPRLDRQGETNDPPPAAHAAVA